MWIELIVGFLIGAKYERNVNEDKEKKPKKGKLKRTEENVKWSEEDVRWTP